MQALVLLEQRCLSVRLSVCHSPVLYQNEQSYSVVISSPAENQKMTIFAYFARYIFWNLPTRPELYLYTVMCSLLWLFTDTEISLDDVEWP